LRGDDRRNTHDRKAIDDFGKKRKVYTDDGMHPNR